MAVERDALLSRIQTVLHGDARVVAAWLSGSFGRAEADEWSDLDVWVVVTDAGFASFVGGVHSLYCALDKPILVQPPIPGNAPPGGFFQLVLFEGALEVDWTVVPLSDARRPAASVLLFERQNIPLEEPEMQSAEHLQESLLFFWAMAPIGVKYVARGHTASAVGMISLLRGAYEAIAGAAETPRLGETIRPQDCLEVMQQLWSSMEQQHPRLAALGVEVPSEVPAAVRQLADRAIRERRSPRLP